MGGKHCSEEVLISAYLDAELSGADAARAERHLAECRGCSDFYQSMIFSQGFLSQCFPEMEPPAAVKARVFEKINAGPGMSPASGLQGWAGRMLSVGSRPWAYACASLLFLAIITSVFVQRRIEDGKILAEIDRSRAEWVSRDHSLNPFNIDINGAPLRLAAEHNPFTAYLTER
jgi:anti-sigma factor RsiW